MTLEIPEVVIWIVFGFILVKLVSDLYGDYLEVRLKRWRFRLDDERTRLKLGRLVYKVRALEDLVLSRGEYQPLVKTAQYRMLISVVNDITEVKADDD
jgi:hypothetical protein